MIDQHHFRARCHINMQVHHQSMSDPLQCTLCGTVFGRAWLLKQHSLRKTPCVIIGFQPDRLTCSGCGRKFSRIDSLTRHRTKCKQPLIKTAEIVEIAKLRADVEELRKIVELAKPQQLTNVTNNVNNTVNNTINNVTIAPWGSPLALTDADVEAALAQIPGLAGTPAMPEVVAALMELVKRAHLPDAARNVYLNPKRGDQALARQSPARSRADPVPGRQGTRGGAGPAADGGAPRQHGAGRPGPAAAGRARSCG